LRIPCTHDVVTLSTACKMFVHTVSVPKAHFACLMSAHAIYKRRLNTLEAKAQAPFFFSANWTITSKLTDPFDCICARWRMKKVVLPKVGAAQ